MCNDFRYRKQTEKIKTPSKIKIKGVDHKIKELVVHPDALGLTNCATKTSAILLV